MKKLFCDKCGKLIDVTKTTIINPVRHYTEFGYDMCESCHNDFINEQTKFLHQYFQSVIYERR